MLIWWPMLLCLAVGGAGSQAAAQGREEDGPGPRVFGSEIWLRCVLQPRMASRLGNQVSPVL